MRIKHLSILIVFLVSILSACGDNDDKPTPVPTPVPIPAPGPTPVPPPDPTPPPDPDPEPPTDPVPIPPLDACERGTCLHQVGDRVERLGWTKSVVTTDMLLRPHEPDALSIMLGAEGEFVGQATESGRLGTVVKANCISGLCSPIKCFLLYGPSTSAQCQRDDVAMCPVACSVGIYTVLWDDGKQYKINGAYLCKAGRCNECGFWCGKM